MSDIIELDQTIQICLTCGTQFEDCLESPPTIKNCKICDDPRQFVPPGGQQWTTLKELRSQGHKNKFADDEDNLGVSEIWTEPKVGIGQRCFLIQPEHGNVLWDLIAFIDKPTYEYIISKGGISAIVISHPHYYTTHLTWAKIFKCPVYIAAEDEEWTARDDVLKRRRLIRESTETILPGVTAIKCGGHFPGSLALHWENNLFVADTIQVIPSGLYHIDRPKGTASFAFMWSYPNMIPLAPDAIHGIWKAIKPYDFIVAHGAFPGLTIKSQEVKKRVLDSMKIHVKASGHVQHALLEEEWG